MYEPDVWKREWGYRCKFGSGEHIKNKALGGMKSPRKSMWVEGKSNP